MNFIKENIKALKREYGFPVILCNIVSTDLDLDTGEKRRTLQIRYIPRAVLLPVKHYYKEGYNPNDRDLLVDYSDFNIKVGTQVIYNEKCYDVIEVVIFERNAAYILKLRALEGATLINPASAADSFVITETVALI